MFWQGRRYSFETQAGTVYRVKARRFGGATISTADGRVFRNCEINQWVALDESVVFSYQADAQCGGQRMAWTTTPVVRVIR